MYVGELIEVLGRLPEDAYVGAAVRLGDGTHVLDAEIASVETDHDDLLGFTWVTLDLVTDRTRLIRSEALATVPPEALEWVARNGKPLPSDWGYEQ